MKIGLTINVENVDIKTVSQEFQGMGTQEDPIIIDASSNPPSSFELYESDRYIIIRDCKLKQLGIYHCTNVTIENSVIKHNLTLERDSNIEMKNVTLGEWSDFSFN